MQQAFAAPSPGSLVPVPPELALDHGIDFTPEWIEAGRVFREFEPGLPRRHPPEGWCILDDLQVCERQRLEGHARGHAHYAAVNCVVEKGTLRSLNCREVALRLGFEE